MQHVYPDGTAVVGEPPFPKMSPRQIAEASIQWGDTPGFPTAGYLPPLGPNDPVMQLSVDQLRYLARQHLDALAKAAAPGLGNELPEPPGEKPPLPGNLPGFPQSGDNSAPADDAGAPDDDGFKADAVAAAAKSKGE